MSKSKTVTSAKVVAYVNGKAIGRVTGVRWSSDTPRKAIFGIDTATPYELAPMTQMVSGSLSLIRTNLDGGIEALGMTAISGQVVRERYFTLTLVDRTTDTLLFRADFCSVTNQSWDVAERSIMRGTVNFQGIYWNNECRNSKF